MPLLAATIRGYQSYRDPQTVQFDEHLTLVAGRNDVGKSALLRVLRVLVQPQRGAHDDFALTLTWRFSSDEVADATQGKSAAVAGWLAERGSQTFGFTYQRTNQNPSLGPGDLQLVEVDIPEGPGHMAGAPGTSMGWVSGPGQFLQAGSVGHDIFDELAARGATNVAYIGPRTIPAGQRQLTATPVLEPAGSNVIDVLHTLHTERSPVFDSIEAFMRRAFPQIEKIGIKLSAGAPITGELAIYYRHSPHAAVLLDDAGSGIGQMLALATGVLTNTAGRLFLIDEPQAYLHPQAERDLLQLLEEHPEHQYVIATHSHLLLSAKPVTHARLLRIEDGATRVFDATHEDLLGELGITAADLWLADRLIWVEGPTEVGVLNRLLDRRPGGRPTGVSVKKMPIAASTFTAPGGRADTAFRFLSEVVDATRGSSVHMRFLFDRDETTDVERQRLLDASDGAAAFLDVREIENYLLDKDLIVEALIALRTRHGVEGDLDQAAVESRLDELLSDTGDGRFFPEGVSEGQNPVVCVRASRVLEVLWEEFVPAAYRKAHDGDALIALALERKPQLLDPLDGLLDGLLGH